MAKITDQKLDAAIDHIEGLSDAEYEKLLKTFEKEQPELNAFLNEKLEELDDDDQSDDVLTIMIILYYAILKENPDMFIVSDKTIETCEIRHLELMEDVKEIMKTNELLDDEDLSLTFIPNTSIHEFVQATLDPNEEGSPFDEETSEKAYHIIKVCVDCLSAVI